MVACTVCDLLYRSAHLKFPARRRTAWAGAVVAADGELSEPVHKSPGEFWVLSVHVELLPLTCGAKCMLWRNCRDAPHLGSGCRRSSHFCSALWEATTCCTADLRRGDSNCLAVAARRSVLKGGRPDVGGRVTAGGSAGVFQFPGVDDNVDEAGERISLEPLQLAAKPRRSTRRGISSERSADSMHGRESPRRTR